MRTTRRLLGLLALTFWMPAGSVQADPPVDAAALARCFDQASREYGTLQHLLSEARLQRQHSRPGSAERAAAEAAIERLAQRGAEVSARVMRCVARAGGSRTGAIDPFATGPAGRHGGAGGPTATVAPYGAGATVHHDEGGRPVVVVEQPLDEHEQSVARAEDTAIRTVASGLRITNLVTLQALRHVDGPGELPRAEAIGTAQRVATRVARCYDALLEHRGLQPGQVVLSFVVEASGRIRYARLERATLGGIGFRRCLRRAAATTRPMLSPRGGWAGYEIVLDLGEPTH